VSCYLFIPFCPSVRLHLLYDDDDDDDDDRLIAFCINTRRQAMSPPVSHLINNVLLQTTSLFIIGRFY